MQQSDFDITFDEKVRIFSHDYLKCFKYISGFDSRKHFFTKRLYSKLIATSQLLEDFLDFHGAKNNSDWYFYRELTAAVRHLSLAGYSYQHLSNRLVFYDLVNTEGFEKQGEITFDFLTSSIMKMAPVILDEARCLNIPLTDETFNPAYFPTIPTAKMLDYNIDDKDKDQQKKHIVKIASKFLTIARSFDHLSFYGPYSMQEISAIVPEKINEVEIRYFEMLVHSLQSSFDTYVIHGGFRFGNRRLKQLRGYISIVFHLLQM
ncbi:MAG: HPr family phosphocarrier protein, partial [Desulfobacterales bacterium]|nr:HPr family phosphocarrier protein [Desulfobacterales bacterium]